MRICIVSPIYHEGFGYQENIWAGELAGRGHEVFLLAAGDRLDHVRQQPSGDGAFQVVRVPSWKLPRSIFLSSKIGQTLASLSPDLILWFGPGQYFGREMLKDPALAHVPIVTFHGIGYYMHEFDWRKKGISLKQRIHALGYFLLRGRIIKAATRRSAVTVGNVPEARDILLMPFHDLSERQRIDQRIISLPLGYDPASYGYDPQLGRRVRQELGLAEDDVVACMSSQFVPSKVWILEPLLRGLQQALAQEPRLRAMVVGLTDNPTSQQFRKLIADGPAADRIVCQGFAGQARLNELYNAADIAIFGRASISCQAALGTGLFGCFARGMTMDHLITSPRQGSYFESQNAEDLAGKLAAAARMIAGLQGEQRRAFRAELAAESRWLGYDQVVDRVLDRVGQAAGEPLQSECGRKAKSTSA